MSGRWPRPTGCATGSTFDLAGLDVGGGFPAEYGHDPNRKKPEMPSLGQIMSRLRGDLKEYQFDEMPLVAEPGRVIVARCLLADRARAAAQGQAALHQ